MQGNRGERRRFPRSQGILRILLQPAAVPLAPGCHLSWSLAQPCQIRSVLENKSEMFPDMRGDQRELSGAGSEPSGQGKVFCHLKLNMCNPSSNVFCLAVELMPTMQHHAPPLTSAVTALTDWDWCDEITWLGAGKNISRSARTWNCLPCAELPLWKGQSFDLCVLNPFSLAFINSWHLFARFFFSSTMTVYEYKMKKEKQAGSALGWLMWSPGQCHCRRCRTWWRWEDCCKACSLCLSKGTAIPFSPSTV